MQSQSTQRQLLGILCTLEFVVLWTQCLPASLLFKEQTTDSGYLAINNNLVQFSLYACDKKGDFAAGLSKEDITIFENGIPQLIVGFKDATEQPLQVAVFVDRSSSMNMDKEFQYVRSATRLFFERMLRNNFDQATLIACDKNVWVLQDMTKDTNALARATELLKIRKGGTRLYDGISMTLLQKMQFQEGFRRVLIVISDGTDTKSTTSYNTLVELLRGMDITVFVLALQSINDAPVGFRFLDWAIESEDLSIPTGGCFFLYNHPRETTLHLSEVYKQIRNRYAISYRSTNSLNKAAFHKIKVESRQKGLKLIYRKTLSMGNGK